MYDLTRFKLSHLIQCGSAIRATALGARSMEDVAGRIVRHFYEQLGDASTDQRQCVLVRFYKTCLFSSLPPELRASALDAAETPKLGEAVPCLTLLATAGDEPAWNDRRASLAHKAIPLPSEKVVDRFPMISQLLREMRVPLGRIVRPEPDFLIGGARDSYDVFFVPDARDSPHVPAQTGFVVPFGIRSVLGFGGLLSSGAFFSVLLFARIAVPRETADLFKTVALSVKVTLLSYLESQTFS